MAPSTLLLSRLIPRESIDLGRLIVDPQYPDQDFFQPQLSPRSAGSAASIQQIEDFRAILDRSNSARLYTKLLSFLSIGPFATAHASSAAVNAPLCVTRQLQQPEDYFHEVCHNEAARRWLEKEFRRQPRVRMPSGWGGRSVYLVCGYKSLTDAHVRQSLSREKGADFSVSVPVPVGPIPLSIGLDVEVGMGFSRAGHEDYEFTAPGEQVFAVQYRKLRFAWFSGRDVDTAYLEDGNRWKLYIDSRGSGTEEEAEDVLGVEVDELFGPRDMRGPYQSFEADFDEVFYWDDDEMVLDA